MGQRGRGDDKERPKHTKFINVHTDVNNRDPLSVAVLSNLTKKSCR